MGIRISSNDGHLVETRNHSCSYSGLSECFDEDMEEVLNASQDSIRDELTAYGYEPDQLVRDLLIDLDPKVDRLPTKIDQEESETPRINYLKAAFSIIQESVLLNLLSSVPKKNFIQRHPIISGALAFSVFAFCTILIKNIQIFHDNPKENEFAIDSNQMDYSITKRAGRVSYFLSTTSSASHSRANSIHSDPSLTINDDAIELLSHLSSSDIKKLNKLAYWRMINGKQFSIEDIPFLEKITDIETHPEGLIPVARSNFIPCSDSGFYSSIIEQGDTLISVADKCGFNHKGLELAKHIPLLEPSDVVHYNFDEDKNITKITVYQDNNFHILDFDEGEFIERKFLGEEKSIIIDVDLVNNPNLYRGLEANEDLVGKGDLWKKVADKIDKEYSSDFVRKNISDNSIYQVSIKYKHNETKDHYDVVNVQLEKYGS